jgi:hypothetical protein
MSSSNGFGKTACKVGRQQFLARTAEGRNVAPRLVMEIRVEGSDQVVYSEPLDPREFGTGSLGWNANGKGKVDVAGVPECVVQVGCNVTLVGSKELPR